jgi:hypothetical protein
MWRQIPWVANGLTLQGGLELVCGLALLLGGADSDARMPATFFEQWLHGAGPPVLLACGSLKALAANRNRLFRGPRLGVAALWSAIPTATVLPCAPSGLALLVYGSIVYRDRMSRQAFALGESGKGPQDVVAALGAQSQRPA